MAKFKKQLLFALCLFPIAVVAGYFVALYQFDFYSDEALAEMAAPFGGKENLIVIGVVQSAVYALIFGFLGGVLADKVGLWKPIKPEKKKLTVTLGISVFAGILFSLDYWTFGSVIDGLQEGSAATLTGTGIVASVLYGGVVEEVMTRLFLMSLTAFLMWKVFCRSREKEEIPTAVFVSANLITALAFAAGHLPATLSTFGELTPLLLVRCFLLNGGFGLVFGRLYRKYGIVYAMISHAVCHIISKLIWLVLI